MANVLIVFAHPRLEQSRAQAALLRYLPRDERLTVRDLYELYPDFQINVEQEQALLEAHDVVIWQHPMYWYSVPPLLKQWIDLVLAYGWAYGPGGKALRDKWLFHTFSSGGGRDRYHAQGRNRYTIAEFFRPSEQTAHLCHMRYLPPYALQGTHRFSVDQCDLFGMEYSRFIRLLMADELDPEQWAQHEFVNDYLEYVKTLQT